MFEEQKNVIPDLTKYIKEDLKAYEKITGFKPAIYFSIILYPLECI